MPDGSENQRELTLAEFIDQLPTCSQMRQDYELLMAETQIPPWSGRIGAAVEALKAGGRVTRKGWNGPGQYLYLVDANPHPQGDEANLAYVVIRTVQGDVVPWLASQTDLLAEDWELVPPARGE